MLWLANSSDPMPVVLRELGFAPDRLTRTMEGLEISPRSVHHHGGATGVMLAGESAALMYSLYLCEVHGGWGWRAGMIGPDGRPVWWESATPGVAALPGTAREALEEAVFALVGVTDDARLEALGA